MHRTFEVGGISSGLSTPTPKPFPLQLFLNMPKDFGKKLTHGEPQGRQLPSGRLCLSTL